MTFEEKLEYGKKMLHGAMEDGDEFGITYWHGYVHGVRAAMDKIVYCKDCNSSYTPMTVPVGKETPVVTARFCGKTNRLVRDYGYCDEGNEGV